MYMVDFLIFVMSTRTPCAGHHGPPVVRRLGLENLGLAEYKMVKRYCQN